MEAQKTVETVKAPPVESKPAAPKVPKEQKSFSQRLVSGQETLLIIATKTATGYRTEVIHRVGKKNSRGATQEHATIEQARATISRAVADAKKSGWQVPAGKAGFHRPPDQFVTLPKPAKK
jgi:hypothetical protein